MQCLHVNIRQAVFIILSIIVNNIHIIQMANNKVNNLEKAQKRNVTDTEEKQTVLITDTVMSCPSDADCVDLNPPCIQCKLNYSCSYGEKVTTTCSVDNMVQCKGQRDFQKQYICQYCYQTEQWEHSCELKASCNSVASPRAYYTANCTVNKDIICLGNRVFNKNVKCNWTGGYRWATALMLSITLGGFGADRFYLGHWQEGIGKLFSFGGLGVWTIIDVILISLHYLGPADGSLYI